MLSLTLGFCGNEEHRAQGGATLPVVVDDEVLQDAHIAPEDFHTELAILLYAVGRLPLGRAARMTGLNRLEFQKLLGERRIARGPTLEQFDRQTETLRRLGQL